MADTIDPIDIEPSPVIPVDPIEVDPPDPRPDVTERGTFLTADGIYYEGDRQPDSVPVDPRPSPEHKRDKDAWVLDVKAEAQAKIVVLEGQQEQALSPRAMLEFVLAVAAKNAITSPAIVTLVAIDAEIAIERGKL